MINYYQEFDFERVIYAVNFNKGEVYALKAKDYFKDFAEETTTPRGIGPVMHVRGNELWTWGFQGNHPKLVEEFDTEEEALDALYLSFKYDCENSCGECNHDEKDYVWHSTYEEAKQYYLEYLEDLEADTNIEVPLINQAQGGANYES